MKIFDSTGSIQTPLHIYEGHRENVTSVGFHRDTRWIYSAGEDGSIKIWDLRTSQQCQRDLHLNTRIGFNSASLHPNQGEIVTGDAGGGVLLWDISKRSVISTLLPPGPTPIKSVAVSPSGTHISAVDFKVKRQICSLW